MTAQTFGPGRPATARAAIYAVAVARDAREADPWDYCGTAARLTAALEIRAAYSEYGDTFTGH